ncbi:MAG: hypothetical protein N3D76_03980 [Geminocystis sp.]|nr:hypothetical protein [Geminocystis sp.]HIK36835.1 hypothetical protein [Geminocystis sp. M7585_C2015_104]
MSNTKSNTDKLAILDVSWHHHKCFREIQETILHAARELGYDCLFTSDTSLDDRIYIVFSISICRIPLKNLPRRIILYNLEQIYANSPFFEKGWNYQDYLFQYPLWDYSLANISQLKQWGIDRIEYLPIGYMPQLTRISHAANKDIDVLFYGSINERRQKIIDGLLAKGVRVESLFGVYGEERDSYIARSKIVLNIHFYDAKIFEIVRISYLLANRVFVISEKGNNSEEEDYFSKGLVFCDYESLVDACIEYLDKDEEREKIAERGFQLMSQRPATEYLQKALTSTLETGIDETKFVVDFCRKIAAKTLFENGEYEEAIQLYEQSIEVDYTCWDSYIYLGLSYLYNGDELAAYLTWSNGIAALEKTGITEEKLESQFRQILSSEMAKHCGGYNEHFALKLERALQEGLL